MKDKAVQVLIKYYVTNGKKSPIQADRIVAARTAANWN